MKKDSIEILRKKLKNNEPSIGTWQQIPHSSISEILGNAGYEWVAIDLEHGSISISQLPDLIRSIELANSIPIARIAEPTSLQCKQALDAGALGIIAPMIQNREQLELIVEACCLPPAGKRGVGYNRANLFGKNFDEYNIQAQIPLIIAQIESIEAVNNLEEILSVSNLDAVIVGPYDLSASMGITGDFENKEFIKTMNQISELCKKNQIALGDHVVQPDSKKLYQRINEGYSFIAYGTDGVFLINNSICPV